LFRNDPCLELRQPAQQATTSVVYDRPGREHKKDKAGQWRLQAIFLSKFLVTVDPLIAARIQQVEYTSHKIGLTAFYDAIHDELHYLHCCP